MDGHTSMDHGGTEQRAERLREQIATVVPAPAGNRRSEEAAWVRKIQAGDLAPFGELVKRYQDQVYNACWRICGNSEDARDITQEAFLKALDSIGDFRGGSGFYTWLFRIAVNLALSQRRRARQRVSISLDAPPPGGAAGAGPTERLSDRVRDGREAAPDCAGEQRELQRLVLAALHKLDDDFRTVVILRDIEGFDYDEIATILEVPRGTVKSRLHRARLSLREALLPMISG